MSLQKWRLKAEEVFPLQRTTLNPHRSYTYIMMTSSDFDEILNRIKEEAKIAPPGILPKGKTMDSLVGHTVINLSDITLSESQVLA